MTKFREYKGYAGKTTPFTVFLIHGREEALVRKLKTFIEKKLKFKTIILKDEYTGKTIIEKLQEKIWEHTDCALAVMSAEDKNQQKEVNARPNVLFEIGYCLGYFDQLYVEDYENEIHPVILIKEDRTYIPSDLSGIELIEYSKNTIKLKQSFSEIENAVEQRLNILFKQIKGYYKE
jgi:predicted nucleotide-binding protein